MPHTKNQTSWKPGQSGNPAGKPITEAQLGHWIKKALSEARTVAEYDSAITEAEAIGRDLVQEYWRATNTEDKVRVFDRLADRTEGKPKNYTDVTSDGEKVTVSVFVPEKLKDEES